MSTDGWVTAQLGDVVDILDSRRVPVNSEERAKRTGDVPYYGATGRVGWIDAHLFDEELVLLGEDGAPFLDSAKPKAYMIRGKAWVNNHAHVLRARPGFSNSFIQYQLNTIDYRPFVSGTTRLKLPQGPMRLIPLRIAPFPEQRRIVAEIEKQFTRLDAGVAALRRAQANLKRYRASVLKAACEGKLVPTEAELARAEGREYESGAALLDRILVERRKSWAGRGKYKEPFAPDTTILPAIPSGWTWASIEAIGFVTKLAGFEYTKYVRYSPSGDLAVVKAENAGRSGFKRTSISRIESSTVSHLTRSRLRAGDVLMVFVGAGTGNVARVPDDQPYFLGPNIAMIRVETNDVSAGYLEMFLRSPIGSQLSFGYIKAVAQPSLSMGTIRLIPIALPPLSEQQRIVAEVERRLSVIDELEAVVVANLQRAVRLRQAVLQRAFSGEL